MTDTAPALAGDLRKKVSMYRKAVYLVTCAGLAIASAGAPKDAPELTALREAVKALNAAAPKP